MVKKTITFVNFDDEEVTKVLYFNLTKFEVAKLDVEYEDVKFTAKDGTDYVGLNAVIQDIVENPKGKKILAFIENLVQKSYGERREDGSFDKRPEVVNAFITTDAYSELILSFVNNTEELTSFMLGVIPKKLQEEAAKLEKAGKNK